MSTLKITSPAFGHNGYIPAKYTCDGADMSPPLTVENIPTDAKTLALIVDDPDAPAGVWVHWVVWNIPVTVRALKENLVPESASQGMTDFRRVKYGGPCPPSGTHRYFFKLYALDAALALSANANKAAVENAMKGHILAQTELIGLYKRQ